MKRFEPKTMKRFIAATTENRAFLAKAFRVDERTVRNALSYAYSSDICKRIRKLAVERGAVKMVTCNEAECIFDSDGNMIQLLPNGAVIEISKETGNADVYLKGILMIHVDDIHAREIKALQQSAMVLK